MLHRILFILQFSFIFSIPLDGLTLFTPAPNWQSEDPYSFDFTFTYLINNDEEIVHQLSHPARPASMAYLMPDSTLYYPCLIDNPYMQIAAAGGRILKYSWNGDILWDFTWSGMNFIQHHDIEPLPNGNILLISNERISMQEAIDKGRLEIDGEIWPDKIVEIQPTGPTSGDVVWEWRFWDHLIQDVDSTKLNFGIISEHPERLNINVGEIVSEGASGQYSGDWMHANSVHYNPNLDQIVISCRRTNEFYIIDHSTTTEEAATSSGGNSGRGGDFLYRWGNPQNYGRGDSSDQITIAQHSVNWIPQGFPGEGNILIFNNGIDNYVPNHGLRSSVIEITLPINDNNTYLINDSEPFGPQEFEWYFDGDEEFSFTSIIQGGAFRLSNGNTLITSFGNPTIFEVNNIGQVEWSVNMVNSGIARAQKFDFTYFSTSILGDVNQDNLVNIEDIQILILYITVGANFNYLGDLNSDEFINIFDILLLIQIILN